MHIDEQLTGLYRKFLDGQCDRGELQQLFDHFQTTDEHGLRSLIANAMVAYEAGSTHDAVHHAHLSALHRQIKRRIVHQPKVFRWKPYAAAAAILILAIGGWFAISDQRSTDNLVGNGILPGGNRATLTLADGSSVDLSTEQQGIVIQDGITYLDGSAVAEHQELTTTQPHMLTLTTPKGGTYRVTLPDGSNVWLNAASTLRYPSRFSADSREVFLAGEAYFDINSQVAIRAAGKPVEAHHYASFTVKTAGQVVQVLGTQFNLSAYADEPGTSTTLVEGKVKVTAGAEAHAPATSSVILSPGQQGVSRGSAIETQTVDVASYTAWKDGQFVFNDEPLESIMRKIARWYDVEVAYQGVDKTERFGGSFSRYENISGVLKNLEFTGRINFTIEGRRIIATKQP